MPPSDFPHERRPFRRWYATNLGQQFERLTGQCRAFYDAFQEFSDKVNIA
jgi:hypothetical protein